MRHAIYYSPPEADPLTRAAVLWLGRCAFTGDAFAPRGAGGLAAEEIARHTAAPRRYGFHATLVAPFTLAAGESEESLAAALAAFCEGVRPFSAPRLTIVRLDGFLALVPEAESPELDRLAADAVIAFDRFRAPLDAAETGRRSAPGLSPAQRSNLEQWGYPYVFEDFRFHMTLTGRLDDADAGRLQRAAEAHFGPLLEEPLDVSSLALFREPEPGAPFEVRAFHELGPQPERKTA